MSQLRSEDLRALEQTRQRLYQLTQSIGSLKASVLGNAALPPWDSLQVSSAILAANLKSITDHLATHQDLFEKTVVYPSTNYPGRTQENLLGQLLRKKLEPAVEAWVDEGKATENNDDDLEATWDAAKDFIGPSSAVAAIKIRRDPYTAEEREIGIENVNTGLSKPMKMSDDDESQGDEEVRDNEIENDTTKTFGGTPIRTLDEIVRFMTTGLTPEDDSQLSAGMFFRK